MQKNQPIKDILIPMLILLVALGALGLGIYQQCVVSEPQTAFQEIDRQIDRVTKRFNEAKEFVGTLSPPQADLDQKLAEADRYLIDAESAWLDRDFNEDEKLLSKSDAIIREVLRSRLSVSHGPGLPTNIGLAFIVVFGLLIVGLRRFYKRRLARLKKSSKHFIDKDAK